MNLIATTIFSFVIGLFINDTGWIDGIHKYVFTLLIAIALFLLIIYKKLNKDDKQKASLFSTFAVVSYYGYAFNNSSLGWQVAFLIIIGINILLGWRQMSDDAN
jgi:uncharacterized membrane protein YoaT (DUF817 family)